MALVKAGHQLEHATFVFDEAGEVVDVQIQVNYALEDDVTGEIETRARKTISVWNSLPPGASQSIANTLGKRLKELVTEA